VIVSRRQPSGGGKNVCAPLVFLDAVQIGTTESWDVDAFLTVADIEAVEAYNGPASVPPEFNATGAKCGVIAIWRRVK